MTGPLPEHSPGRGSRSQRKGQTKAQLPQRNEAPANCCQPLLLIFLTVAKRHPFKYRLKIARYTDTGNWSAKCTNPSHDSIADDVKDLLPSHTLLRSQRCRSRMHLCIIVRTSNTSALTGRLSATLLPSWTSAVTVPN